MRTPTILLVEDEPIIAYDLKSRLEQEGHQVLVAANAEAALQLCAKHLPDVAILNFCMGNDDGMALARQLRTRYLMRVLFLTGARWQDMERSKNFYAGHEVLFKPYTRHQLKAFLQSLSPKNLP